LPELVEIVKISFPPSEREDDLRIEVDLLTLSIRANSIEEFLSHKELPEVLNNIEIRMIGWDNESNIDKSVYLTIDYRNHGKRIWLSVSGYDQTWVLGKYALIEGFLREKEKTATIKKPSRFQDLGFLTKIGLIIAFLTLVIGLVQLVKSFQ
jgi:hypothetical protein